MASKEETLPKASVDSGSGPVLGIPNGVPVENLPRGEESNLTTVDQTRDGEVLFIDDPKDTKEENKANVESDMDGKESSHRSSIFEIGFISFKHQSGVGSDGSSSALPPKKEAASSKISKPRKKGKKPKKRGKQKKQKQKQRERQKQKKEPRTQSIW